MSRVDARLLTGVLLGATIGVASLAWIRVPANGWLIGTGLIGLLTILAALRMLSGQFWRQRDEFEQKAYAATRSQVSELHSMRVVLDRFPECSLPTTGYSMAFGNLHALLELLDELEPHTIVEFGSGMSTVMTAAWMKRRGRGHVYSFDHDEPWADKTRRHLSRHDLDAYGRVSHASLVPVNVEGRTIRWYDIADVLDDLPEIDILVVDGPPAHEQSMARLPAVPVLQAKFAPRWCVVLDDALRQEELAVLAAWRHRLPGAVSYTINSLTGLGVLRSPAAGSVVEPSRPAPREASSQAAVR